MSTLLETTLRGAGQYRNRNLDLTLETTEDLSDYQYRPVYLTDGLVTASGEVFLGILQNKGEDGIAAVRYLGVSRILLGELPGGSGTVAGGTRLVLNVAEGNAVPWEASATLEEAMLVKIVDAVTGQPVTGAASDIVLTGFYGMGAGVLTTLDLTHQIRTEISSGSHPGWYRVGFKTVAIVDSLATHAMDVSHPNSSYVITPSSHSWIPRAILGERIYDGPNVFLGEALEAAVTGDYVLCKLTPQIF